MTEDEAMEWFAYKAFPIPTIRYSFIAGQTPDEKSRWDFRAGWRARAAWNPPGKPIEPSPLNDEELALLEKLESEGN